MEIPQTSSHPVLGGVFLIISWICGIIATIWPNLEMFVRIGAAFGAIIAAFFASRYHYIATKEKLQSIKRNNHVG